MTAVPPWHFTLCIKWYQNDLFSGQNWTFHWPIYFILPLSTGSVTLHQWQQLAKPNLGGILHPRPGVLTKDFRELDVDFQHVYSLNDLEEDEPDLSKFPNLLHGTVGKNPITYSNTFLFNSFVCLIFEVHFRSNKVLDFSIYLFLNDYFYHFYHAS